MADTRFPDDGILWRRWCEESIKEIVERDRPVLLFVADADGLVFPFLREILRAASRNARLRALLHDEIVGLYVETHEIPENEIGLSEAGSRYHLAVLSPVGLTPVVTFAVQRGDPDKVVAEVVEVLERLLENWN